MVLGNITPTLWVGQCMICGVGLTFTEHVPFFLFGTALATSTQRYVQPAAAVMQALRYCIASSRSA